MGSISLLISVIFTVVAFTARLADATGGLNGLPYLNGPIPVVPQGDKDMKRGPGDFIHPGLWHTHDDLERIKTGVEDKLEPWSSAYEKFRDDELSQSDVSPFVKLYISYTDTFAVYHAGS